MDVTPETLDLLQTLTALSHAFGGPDYSKGGGGNTSAKTHDTMWIKPSGTALMDMRPDAFVALDRARLRPLYETRPPPEPEVREGWVKGILLSAVRPETHGRPSVEAPLHNLLAGTFVVHTHPVLVNGMTSGKQGAEACRRLFPDALWVDYVDPGYTLCLRLLESLRGYRETHDEQDPSTIFLGNHGLFVQADTADRIHALQEDIHDRLRTEYRRANIATTLRVGRPPAPEEAEWVRARVAAVLGPDQAQAVAASGPFRIAQGSVSPDQIVYMRAHALEGEPTEAALRLFTNTYGYTPRVVATPFGVFGLGATPRNAALALELAMDAALVCQLAEAFGGVRYLSPEESGFIDRWEVEAYRRRVAAESESGAGLSPHAERK